MVIELFEKYHVKNGINFFNYIRKFLKDFPINTSTHKINRRIVYHKKVKQDNIYKQAFHGK